MEAESFEKSLKNEVSEYEAVREIHNMGERPSVTDHEHFFTLVRSNEASCKCGWGLFLDNRDQIRGGHLFRDERLIV